MSSSIVHIAPFKLTDDPKLDGGKAAVVRVPLVSYPTMQIPALSSPCS